MAPAKASTKSKYRFVRWTNKATSKEHSSVMCFQSSGTPITHFNQAIARIVKDSGQPEEQIVITEFPI